MMSRRTARNKSRHQAQKASRQVNQASAERKRSGTTREEVPAKRSQRSGTANHARTPRRSPGRAYRRSGWSGLSLLNVVLGIVVVGLFAFCGYLWYTNATATSTSNPTSSSDISGNNTDANSPKVIPTFQQKSGIIWANQELTSELSTQVAQTLHLSADQVETDLQTMTMVQLAEQQGLTADQWHTAMLNALKNDLTSLVSSGQFTQSDADTNNTFYAQHPDHLDDALAALFNGHELEHTPTTS